MRAKAAVCALLLVLLAASCGDGGSPAAGISNPVEGIITEVGPDYIVLKTEDGERIRFDNADTEIGTAHLEAHRKQKLPVTVTHETNGDRLVARQIVDASTG